VRRLDQVRYIRAIGFDDGPFPRRRGVSVPLVGAVCSGTRFEGMVYGQVRKDGRNATEVIATLLEGGKFLPQLHLVLLDGLAFGGFNVVDLVGLAGRLRRPCVAVMRHVPDFAAIERALQRLPTPSRRMSLFRKAGPVHQRGGFTFQVAGAEPNEIAAALARLTDTGRVPEALRLAHLIGAAIVTGESSRRA
jgi:endonuclease V-like protein UPF0215 family